MEKQWTMIWHQAITEAFLKGKAFGKNKTVVFTISSPASGDQLRLKFSNRLGQKPYTFGAARVFVKGQSCPVTIGGQESFSIPTGGITVSDPCGIPVEKGDDIEIRLYYTSIILDNNMIEEHAILLPGNQTKTQGGMPPKKPFLAKTMGAYNGIPSLASVELFTKDTTKAIVAFGDSITALSQWTKPLNKRLYDTYQGKYVLLNSGITGNCLLYKVGGLFGPVFGDKGVDRFQRDVLEIPHLSGVILALGVNDVSYLTGETISIINKEAFVKAITDMTQLLHQQGVRVTIETITPRLGVARSMGKYDRIMEALRLELNDWIRSAGIFDYVFDAEEVVREERPDGYYYGEGLHQGDHLHPNAKGGKKLADAFDLALLTGEE